MTQATILVDTYVSSRRERMGKREGGREGRREE